MDKALILCYRCVACLWSQSSPGLLEELAHGDSINPVLKRGWKCSRETQWPLPKSRNLMFELLNCGGDFRCNYLNLGFPSSLEMHFYPSTKDLRQLKYFISLHSNPSPQRAEWNIFIFQISIN